MPSPLLRVFQCMGYCPPLFHHASHRHMNCSPPYSIHSMRGAGPRWLLLTTRMRTRKYVASPKSMVEMKVPAVGPDASQRAHCLLCRASQHAVWISKASSHTPSAARSATLCCLVQSIRGTIWVPCHEEGHLPSTANSEMVPKFRKKSRFLRVKPASRKRRCRGQHAAHNAASALAIALSSLWLQCVQMSD